MEMRARQDAGIGWDLTPPLPPLASSLYDSFLLSHCSSCFSPLPPAPFSPNAHRVSSFLYCSSRCSSSAAASAASFNTAEHHLLLLKPHLHPCYTDDTADLRAALRLLHNLRGRLVGDRLGGLLTNREKLISCQKSDSRNGDEVVVRVREGAKAMAMARSMRDGLEFRSDSVAEEELEAALCAVVTNAVDVQGDGGRGIGIAVYGATFSWINHSCTPNACYRFLTPSQGLEMPCFPGDLGLRIFPEGEDVENADSRCAAFEEYGPRIVVRSIKRIKKGEEVTIAYTDLLQPKAIRQSELWLKYQFICCCRRCCAWPPTDVDYALQEITASHFDYNVSPDSDFYRDEATRILASHIDDAISEYLFASDSESCCKKLETVLIGGILYELDPGNGNLRLKFRLCPLHHLALNAYMTLASAYKIRASNWLAPHTGNDGHQLDAFNLYRINAAYSLLLGGATHHLFLSDVSLIASAANCWTNAGESLLSLAQNSCWNSLEWNSFPGHGYCNCSLINRFSTKLAFMEADYADFEDISRGFLECVGKITPEVWGLLAYGCHHLELFKDPVRFSWVKETPDGQNAWRCCGDWISVKLVGCEDVHSNRARDYIWKLGFHCLVYGGYLLSICYGCTYWTDKVRNIPCFVEKPE